MRATKITKYFEYENKNQLNFFPTKQKKEEKGLKLDSIKCQKTFTNAEPELAANPKGLALHSNPKVSNINVHSSSFDTVNIQLETKYYTYGATVEYSIYFNNNSQLDINGSITNVGNIINGDLMALHEALKYIVYHPNMSQKLNRYKFNIYTNSKTISNIHKPDTSIVGTNLYFKIQSLLKCIKNMSIEYWSV